MNTGLSKSNEKQSCCPDIWWGGCVVFVCLVGWMIFHCLFVGFFLNSESTEFPNAGIRNTNAALIGKH